MPRSINPVRRTAGVDVREVGPGASAPVAIARGEADPSTYRVHVMSRGPRGEKRPADVIGAAIMVGRIQRVKSRKNPSPSLEGCVVAMRGPRRGAAKLLKKRLQSAGNTTPARPVSQSR